MNAVPPDYLRSSLVSIAAEPSRALFKGIRELIIPCTVLPPGYHIVSEHE